MRRRHRHNMVGRLAPGVSVERAQSLAAQVATRLEQDYPVLNRGNFFELIPLRDDTVGRARATLLMILGAAAALLAIACLNIASLSMARALARAREMAMRIALGAGRSRVSGLILGEG